MRVSRFTLFCSFVTHLLLVHGDHWRVLFQENGTTADEPTTVKEVG